MSERYEPTEDDVRGALNRLGRGHHVVTRTLKAMGIKGEPEDAGCCPVANYLAREFSGCTIAVDGTEVTVCGVHIPAPRPIASFVRRFDCKEIPELISHHDCDEITEVQDNPWDAKSFVVACHCEALYFEVETLKEAKAMVRRLNAHST